MGNSVTSKSKSENNYSWKTTSTEIANEFSSEIKNKSVIVTGSNCGIGFEAARILASKGSYVVICSRNLENGKDAVNKILAEFPEATVCTLPLDLSSLKSIKLFVDEVKELNRPINLLINNAGVMACPLSYTSDGCETQFGVNHLGHFYLTKLLLPILIASGTLENPSRVVNLSSMGNWLFGPNEGILFDDIKGERRYDPWERYGQSKLANILFTKELQKRMTESNHHVISVSLHPGAILGTNLSRHFSLSTTYKMFSGLFGKSGGLTIALGSYSSIISLYALKNILLGEHHKTIPQGAATTLFVSLAPIVPGEHYADCAINSLVHPKGFDTDLATLLWNKSEEYIQVLLN